MYPYTSNGKEEAQKEFALVIAEINRLIKEAN